MDRIWTKPLGERFLLKSSATVRAGSRAEQLVPHARNEVIDTSPCGKKISCGASAVKWGSSASYHKSRYGGRARFTLAEDG